MQAKTFFRIGTLAFIAAFAACTGKPGAQPPAAAAPPGNAVTSLQSATLKEGTGAVVAGGQIAVVQYTGWLYEAAASDHKGKQFDSSLTRREAFKFPLGTGSVIKGWDQGVVGMKVGESRRLTIPPDLAYGDAGAGGVIPPGATLVFDIELVGIE
ncbi:MAG TPA: FKBP-type peptidyl-prolyl cis-trans isomerase [Steroidobacteraceae bacterium]|jgi:FKBP-type peptidyl-prolyl cis-trans isomerase